MTLVRGLAGLCFLLGAGAAVLPDAAAAAWIAAMVSRSHLIAVRGADDILDEAVAGKRVIVEGGECRRVRLGDGRVVAVHGGNLPQWRLRIDARVRIRGKPVALSTFQQGRAAQLSEIELIDAH